MSIKREYIFTILFLLLGFAIGVWYARETGASLVLGGIVKQGQTNLGGTNGTATIPVYGMVTAAQGIDN